MWDLRVFSPKEAEETALEKYAAGMGGTWDYRWDKIPKKYYNITKCMDGDTSVISYRGHRIQKTLIRARFSPQATTGQRYIYTGTCHEDSFALSLVLILFSSLLLQDVELDAWLSMIC